MNKLVQTLLCGLVFFLHSSAYCEALDPEIMDALGESQGVLQNAESRAKVMNQLPGAVDADAFVKSLAGGSAKNMQAIYEMAAQKLGDLVKETNGDPAKMTLILEDAKKNPDAFGQKMSPDLKDKIHSLSTRLPRESIEIIP